MESVSGSVAKPASTISSHFSRVVARRSATFLATVLGGILPICDVAVLVLAVATLFALPMEGNAFATAR